MATRKFSMDLEEAVYDELKLLVERYNELHPIAQTSKGAVVQQAIIRWLPRFREDVEDLARGVTTDDRSFDDDK